MVLTQLLRNEYLLPLLYFDNEQFFDDLNFAEKAAGEGGATDAFEAGWLVVRVHWYELKQVSQRGYVLKPVERIIPVNGIVRLLGLDFSNSYATGRQTRSATAAGSSLHFFDEDSHNLVEAACRHEEDQDVEAEE